MSDKSPLFVSSLELIAHATELFAQKNPKKYKFIILHLANAVELILKDCVIDQGMSIYDKPGITITIWESIKKLKDKGVDIPELPVIELLIDDRNTIQHRFGHPSAESTYYYIEQVVNFFQRFLHHHYNTHLAEALKSHLSDEYLKLLGLVKDEFSFLDQLASISIESSVLRASNIIARELAKLFRSFLGNDLPNSILRSPNWNRRFQSALFEDLRQKGFIHQDMVKGYSYLREARNFAAHNPEEASIDWQAAFDIAKELLNGLREAEKAGYVFKPDEALLEAFRQHREESHRQEERRKIELEHADRQIQGILERRKIELERAERKKQEDDRQHELLLLDEVSVINAQEPGNGNLE